MSGILFGKELKKIRQHVGISSKVLSKNVGKAVTYVSQLERGLIKNPNYYTCKKLLEELGLNDSKIEEVLNYTDIKSPEKAKAEFDLSVKVAEEEEGKQVSGYYDRKINNTLRKKEKIVELINLRFEEIIRVDYSRADEVVSNLIKLFDDEELFDNFFCPLFEKDYTILSNKEKGDLISLVNKFIEEKHNDKFGELLKGEEG